jgi:ribonuclease HI
MNVEIFTDGSHFKTTGRLGCGGVMLISGNLVDEFSLELTPKYLKEIIKTSDVSNPTTEMMGVLQALRKFNIPKNAKEVIVYTDYEGVGKWLKNEWKINKPYIKILYSLINKEIESKKLKGIIDFRWVKGHQPKSIMDPKAKWNNYVDKLAKGE